MMLMSAFLELDAERNLRTSIDLREINVYKSEVVGQAGLLLLI